MHETNRELVGNGEDRPNRLAERIRHSRGNLEREEGMASDHDAPQHGGVEVLALPSLAGFSIEHDLAPKLCQVICSGSKLRNLSRPPVDNTSDLPLP